MEATAATATATTAATATVHEPVVAMDTIRDVLRPIKTALVDLFISLARVLFFWLPGDDKAKGQALMVFHFVGGCLLYTLYFSVPKLHPLRFFIFLFFVVIIIQQVALRGCVITRAEQQLTKTSDTILDPWIRLAGLEPSKDLRIICNIAVVGCMTSTLLMNTILEQIIPYN